MQTEKSPREAPPLGLLDPLRRYSIEQAIAYLATSRFTIYKMIRDGKLRVLKDGRRTYCPGSEIVRLSSVQPRPDASHK